MTFSSDDERKVSKGVISSERQTDGTIGVVSCQESSGPAKVLATVRLVWLLT